MTIVEYYFSMIIIHYCCKAYTRCHQRRQAVIRFGQIRYTDDNSNVNSTIDSTFLSIIIII